MGSGTTSGFPRFSPGERRQAILDAAREVFSEQGLAGARTKDIAQRAGVAEGLIFKHFKTKDALFEHAVVDPLDELVKRVDDAAAAFAAADDVRDRTAQAVAFHSEILATMQEIGPLLGAVLFDQRSIGTSFYGRRIAPTLARISEALSLSLRGTPGGAFDPHLLAIVIWGTHFFLALDADYRNVDLDVRRLAKSMTGLLVTGLEHATEA